MKELIERARRSLERLEELQTETSKIATETRRIVRKLKTLEPKNPSKELEQ